MGVPAGLESSYFQNSPCAGGHVLRRSRVRLPVIGTYPPVLCKQFLKTSFQFHLLQEPKSTLKGWAPTSVSSQHCGCSTVECRPRHWLMDLNDHLLKDPPLAPSLFSIPPYFSPSFYSRALQNNCLFKLSPFSSSLSLSIGLSTISLSAPSDAPMADSGDLFPGLILLGSAAAFGLVFHGLLPAGLLHWAPGPHLLRVPAPGHWLRLGLLCRSPSMS